MDSKYEYSLIIPGEKHTQTSEKMDIVTVINSYLHRCLKSLNPTSIEVQLPNL